MHIRVLNDKNTQILLLELSRNKIDQGNLRLDKMNLVSKSVDKVTMNAELLWILMQMDVNKLNRNVDHSEDLFTKAQNCNKRIELMKQLKSPQNVLQEMFLMKLKEIMQVLVIQIFGQKEVPQVF